MDELQDFINIIFDLDNTLYDQYQYDKEVFYKYFVSQRQSHEIAKTFGTDLARKKLVAPLGYKYTFNDFFEENNIKLNVESLIEFYHLPPYVKIQLPEFTKQMLNSVIHKNLILISNGYLRIQYNKIVSLGIGHYFNQIFILSPEVSPAMKPSKEVLEYINLKKGNTVYIGDNLAIDKVFAKNCNFNFIHLDIRNYLNG